MLISDTSGLSVMLYDTGRDIRQIWKLNNLKIWKFLLNKQNSMFNVPLAHSQIFKFRHHILIASIPD